eukprot:2778271-Amphidinium_carterae.1
MVEDLQWIVDNLLKKDPKERPRLDHVMKMPFVQKHIQGLKDYVKRNGTGGCEAMVVGARRRSQEDKRTIIEVAPQHKPERR